MVNKKLVIISYCCAFLFVYMCAIAYAIIPTYLHKGFNTNINLPTSAAMNSTVTAVSEIKFSALTWILIGIIILILILFFLSTFSMYNA